MDRRKFLVGAISTIPLVSSQALAADDSGNESHLRVPNIAALKGLKAPTSGVTVLVDDYHTPGAGGGGAFYFNPASTATDDGGIYIAPKGSPARGRWIRKDWMHSAQVSIKWYGAVCDGVADDAPATQAAINFVQNTFGGSVGGIVEMPAGLVRWGSPVSITGNNVWLRGPVGAACRVTGNDITNDYMLKVGCNPARTIFNSRVSDLVFYRNNSSGASSGCICWSHVNFGLLENIQFYNGYAPLLVANTTGTKVSKLGFFETVSGGIGAYLANFHTNAQLLIDKIDNLGSYSSSKRYTKIIIDYNNDFVNIRNCAVGQISFQKTAGTFAPRWIEVDGCYGESNYDLAAFDVQAGNSIKFHACTGCISLVGANISGGSAIWFDRCTFANNQWDGILIQGGRQITLDGNEISANNIAGSTTYSGVRVTGSTTDLTIKGGRIKNDVFTGPRHAYGILINSGITCDGLLIGKDVDIADYTHGDIADFSTGHKWQGAVAPTGGFWRHGAEVRNTKLTVPGNIGWVNVRAGQAAPIWAASAEHSVGDLVVPTTDNGHVYRCVTAGRTGSSPPGWPAHSGITVRDGTAVWSEAGVAALFKAFGAIGA